MYLTIQGVVLRVADFNDRDALLTVLTQKHGKLTLKARGLRRKNSPLTAACQLLALGEFTVFEYRGQYSINEARVLNLFQGLRSDMESLSLASYFAQVSEVLSQEDYPTPELQSLLLNCLYALSELKRPPEQVKAVFELRAACLSGYAPDLFGCHVCGSQTPARLDLSSGLLECANCRDASSGGIRIPVTAAMLKAMRFICFCEPKRIFSFRLESKDLRRLASLTEGYLSTQLERGFPALEFYKSLCFQSDKLEAT